MSEKVLVSVLITAYNREKYIGQAIESVLASTYQHFELLIIDDCSTDKTLEIAKGYEARDRRVKLIVNEKNLGQFANRNKVAAHAQGKYLKYVDSDDAIYPHTLQIMVDAMLKYPEAGMGFCHTIGESIEAFPHLISSIDAYKKHYFGGGLLYTGPIGLVISKHAFDTVGGFEEFGMPSDNHLSLKIAAIYPIVALQRDLFFWRQHGEGQAFDAASSLKNIFDHYRFNKDVLQDKFCPLQPHERLRALKSGRKNFSRGVLRRLLKKPADFFAVQPLFKMHEINFVFVLRNLF